MHGSWNPLWVANVLAACFARYAFAQAWTELSPIPAGKLQEHITLSTDTDQIITFGGLLNDGPSTDAVFIYNISGNSWETGNPIPAALNHPNAVAYEEKIYVLGGLTGESGWPATSSAWVYTPANNYWATLAAMPEEVARGSAASAAFNGTLFIAGGIPRSSGRTVATVSAYDISYNQWIDLPAAAARLPGARDHAAYAQVGSKFYVIGGRENGVTAVKNTVFILDLANLEAGWKTSPAIMPTARGGLVAAAIGTKIYTFGGEGNPAPNTRGVFNQTEVYDTVTDSWSIQPAMKLPRHGTSAVAVGGKIYIPGGGIVQGAGGTAAFDVFVP